jgi:hypothetical protein
MVDKTVKTPDFLRKNRESGAFCILGIILIYLQRLLPIFLKRVGGLAVEAVIFLIFLELSHMSCYDSNNIF